VRDVIRYSEAFKRQVVGELERGKYSSPGQASRAYGIRGATTVHQWVRSYGNETLLARRIRVETMKERDELKEARKRIRALEQALSNANLRGALDEAFLEIACEKIGTTPEELKKKSGLTLSAALSRRVPVGGIS
jgi:transposase